MSHRREFQTERELIEDLIRRLDDLERNQHPITQIDGQTYYVDPRSGELTCLQHCLACDPCEPVPVGLPIWMCTTLRHGDTTWTSLGGDTRTLDSVVATTVADGGLTLEAHTGSTIQIYDPGGPSNLGAGVFELEVELSTWWTAPDGWESYSYALVGDWNGIAQIVNTGWWDNTPTPSQYALSGAPSPSFITSNPSAVGLTGWGRGRMRYTINSATGAAELFLAQPGGSWTSQGTATFTGGTVGAGVNLRFQENGQYQSPAWWTRPVIHSLKTINAGVTVTEFTEADLAAAFTPHAVGVDLLDDIPISNSYIIDRGSIESRVVITPGGAPLFLRERQGTVDPLNTYTPTVFTDGADLVQPAIAYANLADPGLILIANEQPSTFTSDTDAHYVYAVADLDGFTDITNGWPTGYFPFGSTIS